MFDPIELGREFFERLTEVDAAITAKVAASACSRCGGPWHVGNSPRKPRGGLPVQKSGSDVRFRRPVPTSGSDVRFRSPVPTSGSEVRFRRVDERQEARVSEQAGRPVVGPPTRR